MADAVALAGLTAAAEGALAASTMEDRLVQVAEMGSLAANLAVPGRLLPAGLEQEAAASGVREAAGEVRGGV